MKNFNVIIIAVLVIAAALTAYYFYTKKKHNSPSTTEPDSPENRSNEDFVVMQTEARNKPRRSNGATADAAKIVKMGV